MQATWNFSRQPGTQIINPLPSLFCGLRFLTWVTRNLEKASSLFPELMLEVRGRERQNQKSKSTILSWVGKGRSARLHSLKPRAVSPAAKIQVLLVITETLTLLLQAWSRVHTTPRPTPCIWEELHFPECHSGRLARRQRALDDAINPRDV